MKKLLITGFEPFGGETVNPSWDAVSRLPDEIGEYLLTKLQIPVIFGISAQKVIDAARELRPDVILCIGQAGGRDAITPEMVGINLRYARFPDNNGNEPRDEKISENGETAYFTTVPARKMADRISHIGIPATVSYSAGAYVCNDVLYTLLAHFDGTDTKVGFIHVPYSEEQKKEPSMALCDIIAAITAAIEAI